MYKNIALEIFATFKSNFIPILKIMILPVLLLMSISSISNYLLYKYINDGTSGITIQITMSISTLTSILIGIIMLMTIYKCILEDNQENKSFTAFFKAFKSKEVEWFIINFVLVTIGFALAAAVIFFTINFMVILIDVDKSVGPIIAVILGITLAALIYYARVIIILPATAIGDRIDLLEAFRLTGDYKLLSLFVIFVMPFIFVAVLFIIVVLLLTAITYTVEGLYIIFISLVFNSIFGVAITIFTNVCISVLYKHIKQNSTENTAEQVEETTTENEEISKED